LLCINCVECTEEIQFSIIIRSCVAQNRHLNVHGRTVMGTVRLGE
jgi:hypothetical protein